MDPDKIIAGLTKELAAELKTMAKTKEINAKETHSRIIKNLCQSLEILFELINEEMPYDLDDDSDQEDIPF